MCTYNLNSSDVASFHFCIEYTDICILYDICNTYTVCMREVHSFMFHAVFSFFMLSACVRLVEVMTPRCMIRSQHNTPLHTKSVLGCIDYDICIHIYIYDYLLDIS